MQLWRGGACRIAMPTSPAIAARISGPILLVAVISAIGCSAGLEERADTTVATRGVAATVNGAVIFRDDVAASAGHGQTPQQALDELIDTELIAQAAHAAHITVTAAEVEAAYAEIMRENHFVDDADMVRALSKQSYTVARYRAALERQLLRFRAISLLVAPSVAANADGKARHAELDAKTAAWVAQLRQHAVIDIAVDSALTVR